MGRGSDTGAGFASCGEAVEGAGRGEGFDEKPGDEPTKDEARQDAADQVGDEECRSHREIPGGEQFEDPRGDSRAQAGQGRDTRVVTAVHEDQEDEFGAESLGDSRVEGADAPLGTEGC